MSISDRKSSVIDAFELTSDRFNERTTSIARRRSLKYAAWWAITFVMKYHVHQLSTASYYLWNKSRAIAVSADYSYPWIASL